MLISSKYIKKSWLDTGSPNDSKRLINSNFPNIEINNLKKILPKKLVVKIFK